MNPFDYPPASSQLISQQTSQIPIRASESEFYTAFSTILKNFPFTISLSIYDSSNTLLSLSDSDLPTSSSVHVLQYTLTVEEPHESAYLYIYNLDPRYLPSVVQSSLSESLFSYSTGTSHSEALRGFFGIRITDQNDLQYELTPLTLGEQEFLFQNELESRFPELEGRVRVFKNMSINPLDGCEYYMHFVGFGEELPAVAFLTSSVDQKLTGGNYVTFEIEEDFVAYDGSRVFLYPLPFDLMFSFHEKDQLLVSVDGLNAMCDDAQCDFEYVQDTTTIITNFYLDGTDTLELNIEGNNFDLVQDSAVIKFAYSYCEPIIYTENKIECLYYEPVAGSYQPIIETADGNVEIDPSLASTFLTFELELGLVVPDSDLSTLGGELVYLGGSGFPDSYNELHTGVPLSIDIEGEPADVLETTFEQMTLLTKPMAARTTAKVNLSVNGKTQEKEVTIVEPIQEPEVTSLSPSSVSPVQKQVLTITGTPTPSILPNPS